MGGLGGGTAYLFYVETWWLWGFVCHSVSDRQFGFDEWVPPRLVNFQSYEGAVSSEEELSGGEMDVQDLAQPLGENRDLKDRLLRKFGSHIGTLKLEFSKKKKKGKLPKEARQVLLDWWSHHYKWPYPTEADKIALAESTGLDQRQINNWFINQRKRHWRPSENMQFAVMDSISGPFLTDDS